MMLIGILILFFLFILPLWCDAGHNLRKHNEEMKRLNRICGISDDDK